MSEQTLTTPTPAQVKLMNAAVMPQPGVYHVRRISEDEFVEWLHSVRWQSFIGYEATATHIKQIAGLHVPLSRDQVQLRDGDQMLVARLRYRLQDTRAKADKDFAPGRDDYEYLLVTYGASPEHLNETITALNAALEALEAGHRERGAELLREAQIRALISIAHELRDVRIALRRALGADGAK